MKKPLLPSRINLSFCFLNFYFFFLFSSSLFAQSPSKGVFDCDSIGWSSDPSVNLNISPWGQNPQAVSDGKGGVYALWNANSWTTSQYLQYVDRCGIIRWPVPVEIRGEKNGTSYFPSLSEDGYGGALISFTEWQVSGQYPEEARVRVNRVDSLGTLLWGPYGVRVTTSEEYQFAVSKVVSDGEGGAIVAFGIPEDSLYIQRISASGERLWGDEGIMITDTSNLNFDHILVPDGFGGAIVEWYGYDTGFKRFDSQGNELWHTPSPERTLYYSRMVPDGTGGAVLSGTEPSGLRGVMANRISPDGAFLWGNMGIILSDSVGLVQRVKLALENNGTATFIWIEQPDSFIIYAQRVNNAGQNIWPQNIRVSQYPSNKVAGSLVPSDKGSKICIWADSRNSNGNPFSSDVFAQKLDSTGSRLWPFEDVHVTTIHPSALKLISDNAGGAIVVWSNQPLLGIFTQQVSKKGNLGEILTSINTSRKDRISEQFTLYQNFPNPFNSSSVIRFQLAKRSKVKLTIFNLLGKEIKTIIKGDLSPGMHKFTWNARNSSGKLVASGIYWYRLAVDNQTAVRKMVLLR